MSSNKLTVTDVQEIQPWVRHFLVHVVKRCCMIIIAWIDEMKETGKETGKVIDQPEHIRYNGR